jgi:hypothetical protein
MPSFAQGMFGAQAGIGFNSGGYHSKITPAVEAYYLHKIIPGLYAGGSVFFQKYSLLNELDAGSNPAYGDVISVSQKSAYVFLSPKIDYGFGYRKYLHVYATFGAGFYAGGGQWSNTHSPYWTPPGGTPFGADTIAVNTSYNIPGIITRFGLGFMERIPTHGYWNITLSQEYGSMPGGLSDGPYPFKTSYFCFTVGIMHKYPLVFVEY